jgi:hypothetical protein
LGHIALSNADIQELGNTGRGRGGDARTPGVNELPPTVGHYDHAAEIDQGVAETDGKMA